MFNEAYSFSTALLENAEGLNPVEQLMYYAYGIFGANRDHPRMMQFNIRIPFDAYAVFGPEVMQVLVLPDRKEHSEIVSQGVCFVRRHLRLLLFEVCFYISGIISIPISP